MKPSSYNYVTTLSDGTVLHFNFFTLALIALSPSEASLAQGILSSPNQPHKAKDASELKKLFVDKGFLIDDRINELELLKKEHFLSRLQPNHLSLTIAPSLNCNFNCTYCYQDKNRQKMNQEVEEALIRFVQNGVVKDGGLSVTWYGGEPLLCLDIIERLSEAFIKICRNHNAKYTASIITNGYLLDGETAEKLAGWNVKDAQITIDGPPDIHDKRRPLSGGGKTFQTIMDNMKEAAKHLMIKVRMNVDNRNQKYIKKLLAVLVNEGLSGKINFYLGRTYPYTDVCSDLSVWCLNDEDFSFLGLKTAMEAVECGFGTGGTPTSRNYWCMADNENAFAITPSGGIVKCWNEVADPKTEVGHLLKPTNKQMIKNIERWRRRDPFALECAGCLLLPICMGGCPYLYELNGKVHCYSWKHQIKESLTFYYYLKKIVQESEIVQEFRDLVDYVKEKA